MGQYHIPVNLDKKEKLDPHKLGAGLKLWEQLANSPGTGAALVVLLASHSNGSGGGDLREHPMVGHWRGDRIAFVGDYDEESRYRVGDHTMSGLEIYSAAWTDITDQVCEVIGNELDGRYIGEGWREFKTTEEIAKLALGLKAS